MQKTKKKEDYLLNRDSIKYQVYDKLLLREGFVDAVYKDSLGYLTVGVGHKLLPEEIEVYKVGDLWEDQVALTLLFVKDADTAFNQAEFLAAMAGHRWEPTLVKGLASVCFQLGNSWTSVHKKTWQALTANDFEEAAREVERSLWYKQTPVRVRDFQQSLYKFIEELKELEKTDGN